MRLISLGTLLTCALFGGSEESHPLLLQKPTVSQTHIVFTFAGDLWSVNRAGGAAARLTAGPGVETDAHFSPDGKWIAFAGEYDGNVDVYLMPASGGVPKRLTYHPAADTVSGWSPDGQSILFSSTQTSYSRFQKLFTVPMTGGFPTELPLPMAEEGSFSADGSYIAYVPLPHARTWKRYRGGRTSPVWIARLSDLKVEKLPRDNSNDFSPLWVNNKIYFLSDRNGPVTLFSYDTKAKTTTELFHNTGLDIKSATAGGDAIVFEQFGAIFLHDIRSGATQSVKVDLSSDLAEVRPRFEKVSRQLGGGTLSPTGTRAVFDARGEILTVPADKGVYRNLTNTPGSCERGPAWSPDGSRIAYYSDESGEYMLHIRSQYGTGDVQKVALAEQPAYYSSPVWSPDGTKIAYLGLLTLWYLDLETGASVKVASDTYDSPIRGLNPSWSPDSKWLACAPMLKNHMRAVVLYSIAEKKASQISDGLSDAQHPVFDKNGRYLYFTASTNIGPATAWLDMSSIQREATRSVYVAVLRDGDTSPIAPENDEEKIVRKAPASELAPPFRIDLQNLEQRILALPVPARNYSFLFAGAEGTLFLMEYPPLSGGKTAVHKFEMKTRKAEKFLDGVGAFEVSRNGEKALFVQGGRWTIVSTSGTPKAGEGSLRVDDLEIRVDPRAEWKQMYREVWRIQRDLFYDPGLHGVNREEIEARYSRYLNGISSRSDLTYLFQEMLGELSVGHMNVEGGATPSVKRVRVGLLGADYDIHAGRYRFARVYAGENWNPQLRAPLTEPGVRVAEGSYLLAVDGKDLTSSDNVYSFFEGTADRPVSLRVGPDPSGAGAREVVVVPIEDEGALRNRAWVDANRKRVDKLSQGRIAYVYLPTTGAAGFSDFNRYYFAQIGKQAAIIDERFNRGGNMGDYIIESLNRPLLSMWHTRAGEDFSTPQGQIFGPKVLITNEFSASGGDALAWMFRQQKVGTIVGKRTWGGLVGIFNIPTLVDGGFVSVPNVAFYVPGGDWEVENRGVAPDIEVEQDPAAVRTGMDPQLDKAVEVLLADLDKRPRPNYTRPAFPNYHKQPGTTAQVTPRP